MTKGMKNFLANLKAYGATSKELKQVENIIDKYYQQIQKSGDGVADLFEKEIVEVLENRANGKMILPSTVAQQFRVNGEYDPKLRLLAEILYSKVYENR